MDSWAQIVHFYFPFFVHFNIDIYNGQVQVDISYIETEIEEDLDHILGGLSDIDKRIVKFRFIEGYSIEEISDQLSLSKKTVYNRIYYAKQKIIKRIGGVSDEK